MARSMMAAHMATEAARLTREAEALAHELDQAAEAGAAWADPMPDVDTDREALVAQYMDALWSDYRARPSLLARVREETRGRMIAPPTGTREEWRTSAPAHYLRAGGMAADSVATCLGFAGEDALRAAIVAEAGTLARCKADLRAQAERLADDALAAPEDWVEVALGDGPDLVDLRLRAHAAAAQAKAAHAGLVCLVGDQAAEVAMAAARVSDDTRDVALVVSLFLGETLSDLVEDVAQAVPSLSPIRPRRAHRGRTAGRYAPAYLLGRQAVRRTLATTVAGAAALAGYLALTLETASHRWAS